MIKNRKELTDEKLNSLEEVVMDSVKARAVIDASKSSMGMDISVLDLLNIELFADRVIALAEYRYINICDIKALEFKLTNTINFSQTCHL